MFPRRPRQGSTLLATVVILTALSAFLGLAVDNSYFGAVKNQAQTAADLAALSVARQLTSASPRAIEMEAREAARLNGFPHGADRTSVTTHHPPLHGGFAGDPAAVEVVVERQVNAFFFQITGQRTLTVSARSVARSGAEGAVTTVE